MGDPQPPGIKQKNEDDFKWWGHGQANGTSGITESAWAGVSQLYGPTEQNFNNTFLFELTKFGIDSMILHARIQKIDEKLFWNDVLETCSKNF